MSTAAAAWHLLTCKFCRAKTKTTADAKSYRTCQSCGKINTPSNGYRRFGTASACGVAAEEKYAQRSKKLVTGNQ